MGYASAMAWVLFIIILIFTDIQFRLSDRWVFYEGDLVKDRSMTTRKPMPPRAYRKPLLSRQERTAIGGTIWFVILAFFALVLALPLIWLISTSLKSRAPRPSVMPPKWIPSPLRLAELSRRVQRGAVSQVLLEHATDRVWVRPWVRC